MTGPAKRLARRCYERSIDDGILVAGRSCSAAPSPRPSAAEQRPQLEDVLWQHVAGLLRQRRHCDTTHRVAAPPAAACVSCAIARQDCPQHCRGRCRVCSGPMHRSILEEGFDTHPCCDRTIGPGTYAALEYVTQMLGATPLPQPA